MPRGGANRTAFEDKYLIMLDGCWLWAKPTKNGYGKVRWAGTVQWAHRVSYAIHRGPIPAGLTLDHLCRRPSCVNPWHLEPVTHAENMARGAWATRTHCPSGHSYAGENLINKRDGSRACRECKNARRRVGTKARA